MISSVYTLLMVRRLGTPIDVSSCIMDAVVNRMDLSLSLPHLVPLMPQNVIAISTGSTNISVNWTEPAVSFREYTSMTGQLRIDCMHL